MAEIEDIFDSQEFGEKIRRIAKGIEERIFIEVNEEGFSINPHAGIFEISRSFPNNYNHHIVGVVSVLLPENEWSNESYAIDFYPEENKKAFEMRYFCTDSGRVVTSKKEIEKFLDFYKGLKS
ncbi:hypothetical protein D6829_02465 [Candidatus Pacearchaeota archaeon]|nr:MAG: hypothetical protein D6829_02465 [Candidatus Pacearchaeota archaeon]